MIALGLVCLLLAAAVTVGMLVTGTSQDVLFENRVGELTTSPLWIFVAGVLVTLLTLVGLSVFSKGTKHRVARRKEMNRLRKVEQEYGHPTDQTTTPDGTQTSESDADSGYRQQQGGQRPVVELPPHDQSQPHRGQHQQSQHQQGQHQQIQPASGTSVTLGEQQRQEVAPGTGAQGATPAPPPQQHER